MISTTHGCILAKALPSMFLGDSSAVNAAKHGGAAVGRGIQRWTAGSKRRGEAAQVKAEVLSQCLLGTALLFLRDFNIF